MGLTTSMLPHCLMVLFPLSVLPARIHGLAALRQILKVASVRLQGFLALLGAAGRSYLEDSLLSGERSATQVLRSLLLTLIRSPTISSVLQKLRTIPEETQVEI